MSRLKRNHRFTRKLVMKFSFILFFNFFCLLTIYIFIHQHQRAVFFCIFAFLIYLCLPPNCRVKHFYFAESCVCTVAVPSRHVSKSSQFIHAEFCNTVLATKQGEPRKYLLWLWQKLRGQSIARPEEDVVYRFTERRKREGLNSEQNVKYPKRN